MNSKPVSFVTYLFVILIGIFYFNMPDAIAQTQTQSQNQQQLPQNQATPSVQQVPVKEESVEKPKEVVFHNGVKMEVVREGNGPKPEPNAIVQIQYIGHLEDGTEFDRSYSRRYPSIYKLSDVIGCWQTGIPEMNVGSKVKFTCPPGSANGKRPVDFIWGDTTLYFIIELIAIVG